MSFQRETERLIIRDIREDDIPILIKQFAEPEAQENILSYQSGEVHNRKIFAAAMEWAKHPQREYFNLSVIRKEDESLIGSCTISHVRSESFETGIGWHFGHQYRGNGYATEAARELLYIGFMLNEVSEIYADCFVGNKASIRIMEKIGMHSGWNLALFNTIRGWSYGENNPTVRYIISRQQWLENIK